MAKPGTSDRGTPNAAKQTEPKPTIVLLHGAWADSSA
jgi:hypothetical protein